MYKSIFPTALLALWLSSSFSPAAQAQVNQSQGFTAGSGNSGTENEATWGNYYGPSAVTGNQSTTQGLPAPMSITGLSSQTATGMPIPGTFIAPANLALQNQGWLSLPVTNLDSFVAQSGYNDFIYGDEGVDGAPPYGDFDTIGDGLGANSGTLTTGHQSNLPSAWGWPF